MSRPVVVRDGVPPAYGVADVAGAGIDLGGILNIVGCTQLDTRVQITCWTVDDSVNPVDVKSSILANLPKHLRCTWWSVHCPIARWTINEQGVLSTLRGACGDDDLRNSWCATCL